MATILRCKRIDLTPKRCERILYGDLSMFVPRVIRACLVHDNVFVRRHRQPNVDLKPDAVTMLVAGCDHLDAATCNSLVVDFKPFDLTQYLGPSSVR